MELQIYSVYDKKTQAFNRPYFVQNDQVAKRAISSSLENASELSQHPDDFAIYNLGNFTDDSGKIEPNAQPQFVSEVRTLLTDYLRSKVDPRQLQLLKDNDSETENQS